MSTARRASVAALCLLAACSAGEARPRAWGAPRLAEGDGCPLLIGRYLVDETPLAAALALRHVSPGAEERTPVSFAVVDQGDSTLTVSVRYTAGDDAAGQLRRGGTWAGDYFCDDGWLQLRLDGGPTGWDAYARPGDHTAKRRTLRLAPAPDGALIARLDAHWFEGFQPYAPGSGDGIPLPWTWTSAHAWLRTEAYSEAALARQRARGPGTIEARIAAEEAGVTEADRRDPVWRENDARENPPPDAGAPITPAGGRGSGRP